MKRFGPSGAGRFTGISLGAHVLEAPAAPVPAPALERASTAVLEPPGAAAVIGAEDSGPLFIDTPRREPSAIPVGMDRLRL
mmetsp:Transcript_19383/g.58355  ORF Transcript_19383/g.58355 Transcript_19383/m.58355 type:complete len:81 (-) Transcript_19383:408-650(-)